MTAIAETVNTDLFAARVRVHVNAITTKLGDTSTLATTTKVSAVAAINEMAATLAAGPTINDAGVTTADIWSANQIQLAIAAGIDNLIGAADASLDTIQELSEALQNDPNIITALQGLAAANTAAAAAAQLSADTAIANAATAQTTADAAAADVVTAQAAAIAAQTTATTADTKATTNATSIATINSDLGSVNYVATFEAGLTAP